VNSVTAVRLKYLHIYRARHGHVAYYRRAGTNCRLLDAAGRPVDPGDATALATAWNLAHAAFEAGETAAIAAGEEQTVAPKSLSDLIARYRKSVDFQWLKPATKRDYEKALGPLEKAHGHLSAVTLQAHHVRKLRDRYATRQTPDPAKPGETRIVGNVRQANRMIAVLSILMNYARGSLGWRSDNPAERPRRLPSEGEGFKTWTRADFDKFMACEAIEEPLKRAAALGWYTGQRKGDCLAMTRTARAGGWIEVVPAKTSRSSAARRMVMEHPELTRILDAAPASAAVTLLTRADGRPWRIDHFNHRFAAAVAEAGLAGLSFHGLRKGFMAWAAERGATDAELDAIVPHTDPRVRARYRAAADQKGLAKGLMVRLSRREDDDAG
jgi:integrase